MARRKPLSRPRTKDNLRRRPGSKPPRSITLVVCEGETERIYFDVIREKFRLTTADVHIPKNMEGSAPISVVRYALEKYAEPGGYDQIFCVFDRDRHASFHEARALIHSSATRTRSPVPVKEAVSIPCFEIWVLMHFIQTDAPFGRCGEVIARIDRDYVHGYEKTDRKIAEHLMNRLDDAIRNAEWLESRAPDNDNNPYTSAHHVVSHFANVASARSLE